MAQTYRELVVWQKAMSLVTNIYVETKGFPRDEIYGLTAQIRRASVSIPSNIAEGQGRRSIGEYLQFLGHARGSLCELQTQILIAANLKYLEQACAETLLEASIEVARMLNGLIGALQEKQ